MKEMTITKDIETRLCDLCAEDTWDIYTELDRTHMCGICYTYIYKDGVAKHIKQ